jgi:hypothetical protein
MKEADWAERLRKRGLRVMRRERILRHKARIRERNLEYEKEAAVKRGTAVQKLREDNRKDKQTRKRPGPGIFLEAYAYIPETPFDTRYAIPASWTARSFNESRRHREFIRAFVYPYPVPEVLLWASRQNEYIRDNDNREILSPDVQIIRLAKKWVCDIVSGQSFYKRNKEYFTKTEAHWFLSAALPYDSLSSVITRWFYARCRARNMDHKLSLIVSGVFTQKFIQVFRHPIVTGFLDLIARTTGYRFDSGVLGDIGDFILEKIQEYRESKGRTAFFSFNGRTIASLTALVNEWHTELHRRREAEHALRAVRAVNDQGKPVNTERWKGLGIGTFQYAQGTIAWVVSELRTARELLDEGRRMKNCVASYGYSCATGECAIFNLSCRYEGNGLTDSIATLEVKIADKTLVQAKGKCNSRVTASMMNVITRWAQANKIKIKLV